MTNVNPSDVDQNPEIHNWYDVHAHEFADAEVIEQPFIGKSAEFQSRMNRFKLWAIDCNELVNLNGKHVLEFGAGHGRLAFAYPGMASYTGVDYSRNLVELGNRRLQAAGLADRAHLVHGDVTLYDGPRRHYDVVCSLGMLCYFPHPEPVLAAMEPFLKSGGTFFFDFRVASRFYGPIRRLKWALRPPTGGATYVASPDKIEAFLRSLGLANIHFRSREFPFLAQHYASTGKAWPLSLRNRLASSKFLRPLATESWIFTQKPSV